MHSNPQACVQIPSAAIFAEMPLAVKNLTFYLLFSITGTIKGRVHCFAMQVAINKYFLLNPEKNIGANRLII